MSRSSLAIFLGFGDGEHSQIKSLRIGAFGILAALSALLGVYIRANGLLSPSLESLKADYVALGYSEKEALEFIKFLIPEVSISREVQGEYVELQRNKFEILHQG